MKYIMFQMNPTLKQFLREKRGKYLSILLNDNDRSLSVSRRFLRNLKERFTNHKRKHNVRLKAWHELNNKT